MITTSLIAIAIGLVMLVSHTHVIGWLTSLMRRHVVVVRHISLVERALKLALLDSIDTVDDILIAVSKSELSSVLKTILLDAELNDMPYAEVSTVLNLYTATPTLRWAAISNGIQLQTSKGEVDFVWSI